MFVRVAGIEPAKNWCLKPARLPNSATPAFIKIVRPGGFEPPTFAPSCGVASAYSATTEFSLLLQQLQFVLKHTTGLEPILRILGRGFLGPRVYLFRQATTESKTFISLSSCLLMYDTNTQHQ